MNTSSRSASLQAYNLFVFRNRLHPEFFEISRRRRIKHGEYEFEAWVTSGGHVVRFEHGGLCITEVVTERSDLPDRGLVASLPCAGEKDHETDFSERVSYMVSIQTETLTDHLYLDTFNEMVDHGRDSEGIMTTWGDEDGQPNLSLVDIQRYCEEVNMQCYHLRSDCGLVLRTQTIFQLKGLT